MVLAHQSPEINLVLDYIYFIFISQIHYHHIVLNNPVFRCVYYSDSIN